MSINHYHIQYVIVDNKYQVIHVFFTFGVRCAFYNNYMKTKHSSGRACTFVHSWTISRI